MNKKELEDARTVISAMKKVGADEIASDIAMNCTLYCETSDGETVPFDEWRMADEDISDVSWNYMSTDGTRSMSFSDSPMLYDDLDFSTMMLPSVVMAALVENDESMREMGNYEVLLTLDAIDREFGLDSIFELEPNGRGSVSVDVVDEDGCSVIYEEVRQRLSDVEQRDEGVSVQGKEMSESSKCNGMNEGRTSHDVGHDDRS